MGSQFIIIIFWKGEGGALPAPTPGSATENELWPSFPDMTLGYPGVILPSLRPTRYSVN